MSQAIKSSLRKPVSSSLLTQELPIDSIHITGDNWRQEFDEADLQELGADILDNGLLEAIVVRAWPKGPTRVSEDLSHDKRAWRVWRGPLFGDGDVRAIAITDRLSQIEANRQCDLLKRFDFALIAGERRLRACRRVGLQTITAQVRECDDATAEKLMVAENAHRKDLHELEYAAGYARKIAEGYTVEQLAQIANKGVTVIREYLNFAKLPNNARKAFRAGVINKSHAVLIGTIPDEARREEFAKQVITGGSRGDAMSFRAAKELKERSYMKELKGAPFALNDPTLDPNFGFVCLNCPHYNGNTPKQWQGKRADICLYPDHYQKLVRLSAARALAVVKSADHLNVKVLPAEEGQKLFYGSGYLKDSSFVDTTDTVYDYRPGKPNVPIQQIVKQTKAPVIVTADAEGKLHTLIKKTDLSAAVKQLGIQTSYSSSNGADPQRAAKKKEDNAVKRAIGVEVYEQLEKKAARNLVFGDAPAQIRQLQGLTEYAVRTAPGAVRQLLCKRLELSPVKASYGGADWEKALLRWVSAPTHKRQAPKDRSGFLWTLLAQLQVLSQINELVSKEWGRTTPNKEDVAMCAAFGIDVKKIAAAERTKYKTAIAVKAKKKGVKR